jgi:hypothetical protein
MTVLPDWTPSTPEELAARYVWWQPAAETLERPIVLLWQILKIGTAEDYVLARRIWGEAALKAALENALPGALDERSWAFWRRYFRLPSRPPPRRRFA